MSPELSSSLSLAGPELLLAVGALFLLMVGVYAGEASNRIVTGLAVVLLIVAGAWVIFADGQGSAFGNAFVNDEFARFMKVITLIGSRRDADHVDRIRQGGEVRQVRVSGPGRCFRPSA